MGIRYELDVFAKSSAISSCFWSAGLDIYKIVLGSPQDLQSNHLHLHSISEKQRTPVEITMQFQLLSLAAIAAFATATPIVDIHVDTSPSTPVGMLKSDRDPCFRACYREEYPCGYHQVGQTKFSRPLSGYGI